MLVGLGMGSGTHRVLQLQLGWDPSEGARGVASMPGLELMEPIAQLFINL